MRKTAKALATVLGLLPIYRAARQSTRQWSPQYRAKRQRAAARREKLKDLYGSWVGPGDLCFDVGANVGARVEILRELGGKVVAVEPQESCISTLTKKFQADPEVVLIAPGLGARPGEQVLYLSSDLQTSSMSQDWIESVSERLSSHRWQDRKTVPITTLDQLIQEHGTPAFCKIDVEGFELEVLRGLSRPLPMLSFEYTPERLEPAFECIEHLESLGHYELNFSEEEDFELGRARWLSKEELQQCLRPLRSSKRSGDIYARLVSSSKDDKLTAST